MSGWLPCRWELGSGDEKRQDHTLGNSQLQQRKIAGEESLTWDGVNCLSSLGWIATGLAKEKKVKKGKDEVKKKTGRKWKVERVRRRFRAAESGRGEEPL